MISSIVLEDFIDSMNADLPETTSKVQNLNKKIKTYLDGFLKTFSSLESNDEEIELYNKFMDEFERLLISKTLEFCKGNQIKTAKIWY